VTRADTNNLEIVNHTAHTGELVYPEIQTKQLKEKLKRKANIKEGIATPPYPGECVSDIFL
jgi:hypothetical protein